MPRDPEKLRAWRQANRAKIREQQRTSALRYKERYQARQREYYQEHAEEIRAKARAKRQSDPDARRAYERAYNEAHREEINAKAREHYAKHRTDILARIKERKPHLTEQARARNRMNSHQQRIRHPDRVAKRVAAWAKAHPERRAIAEQKRRTKKQPTLVNDFTAEQAQMVLTTANGVCVYCPVYKPGCPSCRRHSHILTLDHIIPLANGGSHTLSNIVACCKSCNSKKGIGPAPLAVQPLLL